MRITKNQIEIAFKRLCNLQGKTEGDLVGNWKLDYYASGGGWRIVEYGKDGSVYHPLLSGRLKNREFFIAIHMAIAALDLKQRDGGIK